MSSSSCMLFFFMFFFSLVVFLFWSKMVCVAVCRLELNAADWNLNCDLAVANCESAAELPIKLLSSSLSRLLFFRSVYFSLSFCLSWFFCYFKSSDQPFVKLPNVWRYFSVHKKKSFYFFHQMDISVSSHVTCYSFKGSGVSDWCCNAILPESFCVSFYSHLSLSFVFIS